MSAGLRVRDHVRAGANLSRKGIRMVKKHAVQFSAQPIRGTDLDFRPARYWDAPDPAAAITRNIKGQWRREIMRDFISGDAPVARARDKEFAALTREEVASIEALFVSPPTPPARPSASTADPS